MDVQANALVHFLVLGMSTYKNTTHMWVYTVYTCIYLKNVLYMGKSLKMYCVYVHTYACMYGWMEGWMDGQMVVCVDVCIYVCMYVCYIYIFIQV